jgi:predicted small integral membrane protein
VEPTPAYDDDLSDEQTVTAFGPRSQIADPEDLVQDARKFVRNLGQADKLVFGGAVVLLVSGFLPWKETAADGEILGMMSLGIIAMLAAIGQIAILAMRTRKLQADPHANVLLPWMGQLVVALFCIFWCIIFMKVSSDSKLVPTAMGDSVVQNSVPAFGVYLGLLGALASLGGTLLGLKEKPE